MLEIINSLKPFFEDNYKRIHVREYARLQKISPPTASKTLSALEKKGLLKKETDKQYINYLANKESDIFIDLSRIHWKTKLKQSGLISHIKDEMLNPIIILFGSLAKAEAKKDSDIDLAIFTITKKELKTQEYERKLKRNLQILTFNNLESAGKELRNNILNGYKIEGSW